MEILAVYYRVSTKKQETDIQKNATEKFIEGKSIKIYNIYEEKMSGKYGWEREQFKKMIDNIDNFDGIILYDWDRISRDEAFAVNLMYMLRDANKYVYESKSGQKLDFNQMQYRLLGFIKSMMAEDDRIKRNVRQKDGIENFIEKNKRWGPFKKYGKASNGKPLNKESFWQLYEQYRNVRLGKSAICRIIDITKPTLLKRLNENIERYKKIEEIYKKGEINKNVKQTVL